MIYELWNISGSKRAPTQERERVEEQITHNIPGRNRGAVNWGIWPLLEFAGLLPSLGCAGVIFPPRAAVKGLSSGSWQRLLELRITLTHTPLGLASKAALRPEGALPLCNLSAPEKTHHHHHHKHKPGQSERRQVSICCRVEFFKIGEYVYVQKNSSYSRIYSHENTFLRTLGSPGAAAKTNRIYFLNAVIHEDGMNGVQPKLSIVVMAVHIANVLKATGLYIFKGWILCYMDYQL